MGGGGNQYLLVSSKDSVAHGLEGVSRKELIADKGDDGAHHDAGDELVLRHGIQHGLLIFSREEILELLRSGVGAIVDIFEAQEGEVAELDNVHTVENLRDCVDRGPERLEVIPHGFVLGTRSL